MQVDNATGPDTAVVVEGGVCSLTGVRAGGLRVRIVDRAVGREALSLGEAETDDNGNYRVAIDASEVRRAGKQELDLQALVYAGDLRLGASEVRYNASGHVVLDVRLDASASSGLRSEHELLTGAVSRHYQGDLRDLKETEQQQDIAYLANKTGWDARAVALAALADQFSVRSREAGSAIEPAFYYALFRAGLPADEESLYLAEAATVEALWVEARQQGVLPASLEDRVPVAVECFRALAAQHALRAPALAGVSSLHDMLSVSLGDRAEQHRRFAEIELRHRGDPDALWARVRDELGETAERRLRLDGKLAYLTLNNAPLIRALHEERGGNGIGDPVELVEAGYYESEQWRALVDRVPIPQVLAAGGENGDRQRLRYRDLLAAQLRLSYPTLVIAQRIKQRELVLRAADGQPMPSATADAVYDFLRQQHGRFEIGLQPVEQFVRRNNLQPPTEVVNQVARIQRVYQITPDDQSMIGLLNNGLDSAFAVAQRDREAFMLTASDDVGGEANAGLIHERAQHVHNTVLNIALSYLTASTAPAIGAHSSPQIIDPSPAANGAPHATDVIAYSTLENLWGQMDYCACEHCRSILSPAAYLVDLLSFLDKHDWPSVLAKWEAAHTDPRAPNGKLPYPFDNYPAWKSASDNWQKAHPGQALPQAKIPLQVLLSRRPDIQHLPLTCDNTHKPLPYIDLVNEALEFFVANGLSFKDQSGKAYPGHSTDKDITPEQLAAAPEYAGDKASIEAYKVLAGSSFPQPLPFHRPLQTLRLHFDKFGAPLPEVMEALRKDDALERASAGDYGWRDILMEALRMSRAEYDVFTTHAMTAGATDVLLTVRELYGYPATTTDAAMLAELRNARALTRRLDITYEDLIEILKTRFVNPDAGLISKLERLGVPFTTLKRLKDGTISEPEFDAALAPLLDESIYGGNVKTWVTNPANYGKIMGLMVLANPHQPEQLCSFDSLELRYANPDNSANEINPFELVRVVRFVRLWKSLAWSIEHTDKAIAALYPQNQIPDHAQDAVNLQRLDNGMRVLLPRLAIVKRAMAALKLKPAKDLLPLLACFAPIDTHGPHSLYRQMFATPTPRQQNVTFADDGYGNVLTGGEKLTTHIAQDETLRSAFDLTGDELAAIVEALGFDANTTLNLANISSIFRHGWLARKLKLSVREFLLLTNYSGIQPFVGLDPVKPQIVHLIETLDRLRAASLKPEQALYLVWNQDISGKSVPSANEVAAFARGLRTDLDAVDNQFSIVDDPDGKTARARMSLVYGNASTDVFFGLLESTLASRVDYSQAQAALDLSIVNIGGDRLHYDHLRKQLGYAGLLTVTVRDVLKALVNVSAGFRSAVDQLYAANQETVAPLFDRFPELLSLYGAYMASTEAADEKRAKLLAKILPHLKSRRKRQQALQAVASALNTEWTLADRVLDNEYVDTGTSRFVLHAANDLNSAAVVDLTALENPGLTAQFYYRDTATGAPDLTRETEADLAYASGGSNPLPANAANVANAVSGIWSGYLEAMEDGDCLFSIEADPAAKVTLHLAGKAVPLTQTGTVWQNQTRIELRAGSLYPIAIRADQIKSTFTVRWETAASGREVIPSRRLFAHAVMERLRVTYVRFLKIASLAVGLKLSPTETEYLIGHGVASIGGQGWANGLPVTTDPTPAKSAALFAALNALLDFAGLKTALAADDDGLVRVLKQPDARTDAGQNMLLTLTRWESASLDALLKRFGKVDGGNNADRDALKDLATFRRVHDAYRWVSKLGIAASALIKATTNEPKPETVRDLEAALRARYQESDWLGVVKPINDQMRELQRDALVAYILHGMRSNAATKHIDTPDKLFEYFLMDVQMKACMQTSRVRHALSAVQLFIERCLMNLEPRVAPVSINAEHWQWMKRYRVWEANRKVFLWPENWLEPELRDDQSPLFKDTISELLQSDITEDSARAALLNYLAKLDDIARLEPCGIHYVGDDPNTKEPDDIAHVVARNIGTKRKYYYRRREYGYWTPWEQIKLDVEGDPVLPVVWRGRLLLFWLRVLQQPKAEKGKQPTQQVEYREGGSPVPHVVEVPATTLASVDPAKLIETELPRVVVGVTLCWSEYYNGQWQATRTSDLERPVELGVYPASGHGAFERGALALSMRGAAGSLTIDIAGGRRAASFVLYSTGGPAAHGFTVPFYFGGPPRSVDISGDLLLLRYRQTFGPESVHKLLKNPLEDRAIEPQHELRHPQLAPFLYADSRNVFYVSTRKDVIRIPRITRYLPGPVIEKPIPVVPPLVGKDATRPPRPESLFPDLVARPDIGAIDPSPLHRFVADDPYIDRVIGAPGLVRFGQAEIGPAGAVERAPGNPTGTE